MGGVNLRAVAAAAGVSPATVSNAYNRPDRLSAEVRSRVLAIAADLGYSPDPAARSMRTGRAGSVGVLFTVGLSYAFSDPYYVELLTGLSEVAESRVTGLALIPAPECPTGASVEQRRDAALAIERAFVDGVVADGLADDHPAVRVLARRGIPLVQASDVGSGRRVYVDDRAAGWSVGEYLARQGHRRVTVVVSDPTVPPDTPVARVDEGRLYPYSRQRLDGIRDGVGRQARVRVVTGGRNGFASGRRAVALALAGGSAPTAMAADSDVLALGVLAELRERGLRPGLDVAVTGFDDLPAAAAEGLTTVRQPIREKGRLLARMLLDPTMTADRIALPTELIVRESTEGPAG